MFPVLMLAIFIGIPVGFSLMGVGLLFGLIRFGDSFVHQMVSKVDTITSYYVLAAVPLFVFMGTMLEKAGIADGLFKAIHSWTYRLPGSIAITTVILCVIFAAASGVSGATEAVVGFLAIPIMLKHAYDKGLISGTICAGGSLGTVIPPSIVVILLGPIADVPVGNLLIGMIVPGLMLAIFYMLYIVVRCTLRPQDGPASPPEDGPQTAGERLKLTLTSLVPPGILIFSVLGTIILGWATPTEAAAVGAFGTIVLTIAYGSFSLSMMNGALIKTLQITAMVLFILLGGTIFSGVFIALGGISAVSDLISALSMPPFMTLMAFLFLAFLAGFILDMISIMLIIVPIAISVIRALGFDDIWFCIVFLLVIQTSYLTPPMAPAIFYLRGIAPPEIKLNDMYRGVVPFIGIQLVTIALVMYFPELAVWLPDLAFGR
ncbi:MAG: TRAP transporter large permease subunit [Rhizobiaceae bacterium]